MLKISIYDTGDWVYYICDNSIGFHKVQEVEIKKNKHTKHRVSTRYRVSGIWLDELSVAERQEDLVNRIKYHKHQKSEDGWMKNISIYDDKEEDSNTNMPIDGVLEMLNVHFKNVTELKMHKDYITFYQDLS